jgi:DNA-binding CsgD family transcriptional regulator/tetratricopeptide (TPR) repeat protein
MANRVSSRELVGREGELALLMDVVERAAAGAGSAVLVTGEAGVGKSRLVAELGRRAEQAGSRVLVGECVEIGGAELSYAPVVGALRGMIRDRSEPELVKLIGAARPELARLLPELGEPAHVTNATGGQARLFELLWGVFSRLELEQPVLLVLEDMHWADPASLDLLSFLVRNLRSQRLAMVVTLRSDELPPEHPLRPLVAELERSGRARRLDLEPLSREKVTEQVAEILGAAPSTALIQRLFERAQGNPFFTEELLAVGVEGELPASLRDALLVRVRRLSPTARDVVGIAAVAGRIVDHRLLAAVARLPDRELVDALRHAVAHHVLVSDGLRYTFRHALLREAVYADLIAGERAPVHAALARALRAHPELAGAHATLEAEIAQHWIAAGAREPALAAAVRAAGEAEGMYAIADARRHYEHALALWERVEDPVNVTGLVRSELLRRAAEAVWRAGDESGAVALARAALKTEDMRTDPSRAAYVQGRLSTYLWASGDSDAALAAARAAVALLPPDPPTAERARALCAEGRILVMRSRNEEARACCEAALAVARAAAARSEEGQALNYLGSALAFLGDYEQATRHLREAVRIAGETASAARGCSEYENLSEVLADSGRAEQGVAVAEAGVVAARELGMERSYGVVLLGRAALCSLALGRMNDADRFTQQALELGTETFFGFNALEARGRFELHRGEFAQAARHLEAVGAMASRLGDLMFVARVAAAGCELALWRGCPERATEIVASTLPGAAQRECLQHTSELYAHGARAHADLAQAARARRDAGQARRAADEASALHERLEDQVRSSFPLGKPPLRARADAALCAAEVTRALDAAGAALWQQAVDACRAAAQRPRAAYAQWRLVEALLQHGDREPAGRALVEAVARASDLGHQPLLAELRALARRARIPIAGPAQGDGPAPLDREFGLTRREVEVLRLLADGRTNRQIAGQLYISEKTTEHHVSRILSKLGVHTRGAAGAIAHRVGLEPNTPP